MLCRVKSCHVMVWCGVVWYSGMVWYGLVLCVVVWYGMVWYVFMNVCIYVCMCVTHVMHACNVM